MLFLKKKRKKEMTERVRDKKYLAYLKRNGCLVCGRKDVDAHHLRHAQPRGWGLKNGDQWAVPLCREHHMDCHRTGKESRWWALHGIDAIEWAKMNYMVYGEYTSQEGEKDEWSK
jgi:hypothetical protein